MQRRKPVLLIDDREESGEAARILASNDIEFVKYHISKFEESCCGELPTTWAPSVFAPEGVFKGLDGVREYASMERVPEDKESESAYW
jgi:hypothetical protein